jgi:uncharacterized membrane protein
VSRLLKRTADILFIALVIILQNVLMGFHIGGPIRYGIGFVFTAFVPGYLLLSLLFDSRKNQLDSLTKLCLSFPVSYSIAIIIGMIANEISSSSVQSQIQAITLSLLSISLFILLMMVRSKTKETGSHIGIFSFFLISVMVIMGGTHLLVNSHPPNAQTHTSLYLAGEDGGRIYPPQQAPKNTPIHIQLGVEYDGEKAKRVIIRPPEGSDVFLDLNPQAQEVMIPFTIIPSTSGYIQYTWRLIDPDNAGIERQVDFWVVIHE